MNIDEIRYWDYDIIVGSETGKKKNGRIESDVDTEFGSGYGKGVEL